MRTLHMDEKYLLGIDVGGTSVKIGLFTESGQQKEKWSIATNKDNNGEHVLEDIARSILTKWNEHGLSAADVKGAGIGVPGFVDVKKGMIQFAVNIGWVDYPVASILSDFLQIPVVLDNDANLAAAGEYWQGAGNDAADVLLLTLGTGVGGGVIVNGDILHGVSDMAGEIGHVTVVPRNGAPCNCGKTGCLETVSSATGMVRMAEAEAVKHPDSMLYIKKQQTPLTAQILFECAAACDETAAAVVDQSMHYLGMAAGNAANVLNPQRIVIGGGVSAAGEQLLTPLRSHYAVHALPRVADHTSFATAELGNDAGIIGAAWLAKHKAASGGL
ncbi:ROK family glucokinase [Salibacterium halotolerans]|uniref:Glucokinase n=1 Tax=Salibacterium halotolerans TaxID=1884432 RepID=A0A1I5NK80_9BACI|nr:ROK family glucokinase [Salibacterium halotolerans]SFP22179.1 glucokinase [Salibacterium halotolerans]